MTAAAFNTTSGGERDAAKLRSPFSKLSKTLDAFATYRMQRAVPASQLHKADMSPTSRADVVPQTLTRSSSGASDPGLIWLRAARWSVAIAKRVYPSILAFAVLGGILAAAFALRFAIWLPALHH